MTRSDSGACPAHSTPPRTGGAPSASSPRMLVWPLRLGGDRSGCGGQFGGDLGAGAVEPLREESTLTVSEARKVWDGCSEGDRKRCQVGGRGRWGCGQGCAENRLEHGVGQRGVAALHRLLQQCQHGSPCRPRGSAPPPGALERREARTRHRPAGHRRGTPLPDRFGGPQGPRRGPNSPRRWSARPDGRSLLHVWCTNRA